MNTYFDSRRFQSRPETLTVVHHREPDDGDDDDDDDDDDHVGASIIVGVTLAVVISLLSLAIVLVKLLKVFPEFDLLIRAH